MGPEFHAYLRYLWTASFPLQLHFSRHAQFPEESRRQTNEEVACDPVNYHRNKRRSGVEGRPQAVRISKTSDTAGGKVYLILGELCRQSAPLFFIEKFNKRLVAPSVKLHVGLELSIGIFLRTVPFV